MSVILVNSNLNVFEPISQTFSSFFLSNLLMLFLVLGVGVVFLFTLIWAMRNINQGIQAKKTKCFILQKHSDDGKYHLLGVKKVNVKEEIFRFKKRSFKMDLSKVAYYNPVQPIIFYDYDLATPLESKEKVKNNKLNLKESSVKLIEKNNALRPSSKALEMLVSQKVVQQIVKATEKTQFDAFTIVILVLGLVVGFMLGNLTSGLFKPSTLPINATSTIPPKITP